MKRLNKLKEEDGSTMVEAALVMPLVLISLIAIILTIVFLVESLFMTANVHMYLKSAAGEMSKTRISRTIESYHSTTNRRNMAKVVAVEENYLMKGGYLLPRVLNNKVTADSYVINEKKIIRYKDFLGKVVF